jgi:predicted nucleotide-binding protein
LAISAFILSEVLLRSNSATKPGDTVFVVHGRNDLARAALSAFLRALSLKPLEWSQLLARTLSASPPLSEVLDTAFREASAVVVLLTGDDEARLRDVFLLPNDKDYERHPTPQPRQNVLFEAGLAYGRYPNRTALVQIGDMRPISDLAGRYVIHLDNSLAKRQMLADQLRVAGCKVDTTGTDWHTAGDFASATTTDQMKVSSATILSDSALQILRHLASAVNSETLKRDLHARLGIETMRCNFAVDELIRHNFIGLSHGASGNDRLVLLLPGRDYLFNNNLF